MVDLPKDGSWWSDPSPPDIICLPVAIDNFDEQEHLSRLYRITFLQSDHVNLCGRDPILGPMVVSLKYYYPSDSNVGHVRVLLRLSTGMMHNIIDISSHRLTIDPLSLVKRTCPQLSLTALAPVSLSLSHASQLLLDYDE